MRRIEDFFISLIIFSIISLCIVIHLNFDTSDHMSPDEKVKILRDLRPLRVSKLNLKPTINKNVIRDNDDIIHFTNEYYFSNTNM